MSDDQGRDQKLTDEELDGVVGGNQPGMIVVDEGATILDAGAGDQPPPIVIVSGQGTVNG